MRKVFWRVVNKETKITTLCSTTSTIDMMRIEKLLVEPAIFLSSSLKSRERVISHPFFLAFFMINNNVKKNYSCARTFVHTTISLAAYIKDF